MRAVRLIAIASACALFAAPTIARGQDARGALSLFGQVRDGDRSRETEAPTYLYGNLGVDRLPYSGEVGTVFQAGRDFGTGDSTTDLYAGYAHIPNAPAGVDVTLGRQFLNSGPGGVFIADGGNIQIDPGWPVALTVFGGKARYFEPKAKPSSLAPSEDEILWGGNLATTRWSVGRLSVGFMQLDRGGDVLQQLVTATFQRTLTTLPGMPSLYSSLAYDAHGSSLDLGTAGVNFIFTSLGGLQWNAEGTYYKPQDHDRDLPTPVINKREDPIFELFSSKEMVQWRSGLRYLVFETVSTFVDYSFQHYDHQDDSQVENSHIASAGLLWLPGGDGLEAVRAEYYVADSDGGRVNGGRLRYDNRVYERLLFRTKLDIAGYDNARNQGGLAVSSLLGVGWVILPSLICELAFEANHNNRFDEDYRFMFFIDYRFRHEIPRVARESASEEEVS